MKKALCIVALAVVYSALSGPAPARAELSTVEQGIEQYRAENIEEALALLQKGRAEHPDSSVAAFYLGLARKQSGDLEGAVKDLTDAVRLKPPILDAYLELADACHLLGREEAALEWLKLSEEAGVHPGRTAFLKGTVLNAQGKRDDALRSFEEAKKKDVTLAQAANFQIAIALAGSRKLAGARDALRAVIAADKTSEIATYAKEYEQAFTRIIESYRPLRLTLGLNYLYDDNAISNPSDARMRQAIGNPTGQADHAFLGSLRLDYNPMLSGNLIFSTQYQLQATKYGDTGTSDENPSTVINSLSLIPGYAFGSAAFSLPVNYSHVFLKEKQYQHLVTARPTWTWQAAPQHIVQTAASYTRREMLVSPLVPDENRDADIYGASASYIFTYGKGGMASAAYDLSYEKTEGRNWLNLGHRLSLNAVVPAGERLRLKFSGEVNIQDYLKANTVFSGVSRDDTIWFGTFGINWYFTPNVVLSATYAHTTAESNIPLYAYDRNTFSTGIEVSF